MSDASCTTNGHVGKKVLSGPELAAWTRNAGLMTKLCLAAAIAAGQSNSGGQRLPDLKNARAKEQASPSYRPADARAARRVDRHAAAQGRQNVERDA